MLGGNCKCCGGDLCDPLRDRATITISGLPSTCSVGNLANREISDDDCSYTLFRVRDSSSSVCKYATTWHSSNNDWLNIFASDANKLLLNVSENTLTLSMDFGYAKFSPPDGKTFQSFPFDEKVVCTYVPAAYSCSADKWQNVRIQITDDAAAYKPFACPQNSSGLVASYESCACDVQKDTVGLYSRVRSGNVQTETVRYPVYACKPCDTTYYVTETTATTYKSPCVPDDKTDCIESTATSVAWPDLNVSVRFTGPDVDGFSYSTLSGNYALKWTSAAYIGTSNFFGLQFPNWGITNVNNGYGTPTSNTFSLETQYQKAGQGWKIDYRTQPSGQFPMGMTLVVAPVKTTTTVDRANRSVISTQCQHGQFAYQVSLAVFSHTLYSITSAYEYWSWDFSCFANVACAVRSCGGVPSVSLNSTETVYVPHYVPGAASPFAYGQLGQVSVSISS
jgi:hypothetical protein